MFRLLISFLVCFAGVIEARVPLPAKNDYSVAKIPVGLLKDAKAVVRNHSELLEVKNHKQAKHTVRRAITIFHQDQRSVGELTIWYDKFREIGDIEGFIYDADGKELQQLRRKDIKDYSAIDGYSLYDDYRVQFAALYHDRYPYTVEFVYEITYKGSLFWPSWFARHTLEPVEYARFEVHIPKSQELRYWCNKDTVQPVISEQKGRMVYVWEERGLPKLPKDAVDEDIEDITTIVRIAPNDFEMEGHRGQMASWEQFGRWFYGLSHGRDKLPENVVKEIKSLVGPDDDPREKARKLYSYMQSKTRYVSVQLGIGGWQPFDAKYVSERGYGDCKALTNFTLSLLKEAGVTAYPVLIRNGNFRFPMIPEFPSNQFNHVILCVPFEQDTVWLECTSQTKPFGQIGRNNENRYALLVKPEGGVVVRTPTSTSKQNKQRREVIVNMSGIGNVELKARTLVTGNQHDYVRSALANASPQDRQKWILERLQLPTPNLHAFDIFGLDSQQDELTMTLNIVVPRYASASGNRLFFTPSILERRTYIPPDIERLSPIRFTYAYLNQDSIYYKIPRGFSVETLPKEVRLTSSFASFQSHSTLLGDSAVVFKREIEIHRIFLPAEQYAEYRSFFADVAKADRAQVVLVMKR